MALEFIKAWNIFVRLIPMGVNIQVKFFATELFNKCIISCHSIQENLMADFGNDWVEFRTLS
jgi:hypothetical protein